MLLALAGLGHLAGTITFYQPGTEIFVWSLAAAALVFLLVFLHAVRILRPGDRLIAGGAAVGTLVWIGLAVAFGASGVGVTDFRVLFHVIVSAALVVTSIVGWRVVRRPVAV
ncbi:hypothetical protein [Chelativorans sp.]|uniref:hypothetical protein n=1 Tax=Chelativorans sp. TaxID=2203393 RepID=UPI0028120829|nr:hypothetical protein [Chelativorans sp.]